MNSIQQKTWDKNASVLTKQIFQICCCLMLMLASSFQILASSPNLTSLSATAIETQAVSCIGELDGAVQITMSCGTAPYVVNGSTYATDAFTLTGLTAGMQSFTIEDAGANTTTVDINLTMLPNTVSTFAGSGANGSTNNTGTAASFFGPTDVAVDASGNIYVADTYNHLIRKIDPTGITTTFAGMDGTSGSADGLGSAASFNSPSSLAIDGADNVYVADYDNHLIRKIDASGNVTTLAGTVGVAGSADGLGTAASFNHPSGLAVDAVGNVYVADKDNHLIRMIDASGNVTTIAGTGSSGATDGLGTAASFYNPAGVALDLSGNLYVADANNNMIRQIDLAGNVSTLAGNGTSGASDGIGTAATFMYPYDLTVDSIGNIYVADTDNHLIRKIDANGIVSTLVGSGMVGTIDGYSVNATFYFPFGIAMDNTGNLVIGDTYNNLIRQLEPSECFTAYVVETPVSCIGNTDGELELNIVSGIPPYTVNGTVYNSTPIVFTNLVEGSYSYTITDGVNNTISLNPFVSTAVGYVTILAGQFGNSGAINGNIQNATFNYPNDIAVDGSGNIFVLEAQNQIVRKIDINGNVTTVAGTLGIWGDTDGNGTNASFNFPAGIAVDNNGNIFIADGNGLIRKIDSNNNVTTIASGFNYPQGIAADDNGCIFITDILNHTIHKIDTNGNVTTIAGISGVTGNHDGNVTTATFDFPRNISVDNLGNIYVTDNNPTLRKIDTNGNVTTITISDDSNNPLVTFGLAVDNYGNIYVTEQGFFGYLHKIDSNGEQSIIAGVSNFFSLTSFGLGPNVWIENPEQITFDNNGNMYLLQPSLHVIRKIELTPCYDASAIENQAVSCLGGNDGIAEITMTGGTPNFFVSGYGNFNTNPFYIPNLSDGTHSFSISDGAGFSTTVSVDITTTESITVTAEACNNDIIVTASGGTGWLLYSIDNGATYQASNVFMGLANGAYIVTVMDATNCATAGIPVAVTGTCASTCPPDYENSNQLTGTQSTNADYETDGGLDSDQSIQNNAKVDYDSALDIELLPGFEVQLGVEFDAFIDGCDNGGGGNQ